MTFALLVALLAAPADAPPPTLDVVVHARALAPGEIARVVAKAPPGVKAVHGTLHGERLEFVRDPSAEGTWTAWAAIDLDWDEAAIALKVDGTADSGAAVPGPRIELALEDRDFPQSVLKVEDKYVSPPKEVQARIAAEQKRLGAVYARRTPIPAALTGFVRPVPGEPTSVFGARRVLNGEKRAPHAGLDLRAATGTPVQCAGAGEVALAEDLYFSGGTAIVDHGGGLFTVYAHLSRIDVAKGDAVDAGDPIGLSGATGRVTGPHLHWGAKVGKRLVDPTALLDPALFQPPSAASVR